MADQADVETALAALVANVLYPNGTNAASVVGNICRVYRGFPTAPSLDVDLAAGVIHVSITAGSGAPKNVTRYPRRWIEVGPVGQTLDVSVIHQTAAFSGTCAVGQLTGIMVNDALFPYAVQANDSPATVASNLAAMMRKAGLLVQYSDATVGVPGAIKFTARVVGGVGALQEIKRQEQNFKISLWCPDPTSRDAVAPVIDLALASLNFIPLSDGSYGRLIFASSVAMDDAEDATLYRRDIIYNIEYPTTLAQMTSAMLFGTTSVSANSMLIKDLES